MHSLPMHGAIDVYSRYQTHSTFLTSLNRETSLFILESQGNNLQFPARAPFRKEGSDPTTSIDAFELLRSFASHQRTFSIPGSD